MQSDAAAADPLTLWTKKKGNSHFFMKNPEWSVKLH